MRPFNIDNAKDGDAIVTRDGHRVRILAFDVKGERPIAAAIECADGKYESIYLYRSNGCFHDDGEKSDIDLFMAGKKHTLYYNLLCVDNDDDDDRLVTYFQSSFYHTEADARLAVKVLNPSIRVVQSAIPLTFND